VINLCEIKFSNSEYEITEKYEKELRRKADVFKAKSKTQKGVTTVMITANGLKRNQWANSIQRQISADDLFV
ncbi:MAG: ATP-binding protein, partial [Bacteroidales bacterium]|nr:ATP-binding protein [Bacteroidales bacterium]